MQPDSVRLAAESSGVPGRSKRKSRITLAVQQFRLVIRAIENHSHRVLRDSGLSQAQLWLLWEVFGKPGMCVTELSRALSIKPASASNLLDKVEAKGLVRRERGGPDQRVVRLFVTEAGATLLGRAPRPAQGALVDALGEIDDAHLDQINEGLGALLQQLRDLHHDAAHEPLPPADP